MVARQRPHTTSQGNMHIYRGKTVDRGRDDQVVESEQHGDMSIAVVYISANNQILFQI